MHTRLSVTSPAGAQGQGAPVYCGAEQRFEHDAVSRDVVALTRGLERALRGRWAPTDDGEVAQQGRVLFERLLSDETRAALRASAGGPLEICSDLAVPWEALHDGRGFLGLRFAIGTRVPGDLPEPGPAVTVGRVAVVGDPAGDLPAARHEAESLVRAFSDGAESVPCDARFGRLRRVEFPRLCRGAFGLHYAGHADAEKGWRLADGHLEGGSLAGMGPGGGPAVVFVNACGGVPLGLRADGDDATALDAGVFRGFVRAGMRHFVGPWLDVPDLPSADLARDFWRALRRGDTVGEALRRARVAAAERGESVALSHRLLGEPGVAWFAARPVETTSVGARGAVVLMVRAPSPEGLGPEGLAALQQSRRAALRRIVEAQGGRLLPGRGAVDRAVFGLPVSFENDAQRAARAMLDARATLQADARLVLDAGPLVQIGNDVVGACALSAEAWSWQAEPGAWLAQAAARALGLRPAPPAQASVPALLPFDTMPSASAAEDGLLFGRLSERRLIEQAVDEARARGVGRAALVVGAAGIGKSRLVASVVAALRADGVRVARGHARPYDESRPFAAAVDVLLELLELPTDAPAAARVEALRVFIERHARAHSGRPSSAPSGGGISSIDDLLAASSGPASAMSREVRLSLDDLDALRPVLGDAPGTETWGVREQVEAGLVPAAFARVLTAAARDAPVCVVLEDAHWLPAAGRSTLDALLTELTARAGGPHDVPLVVLATARPELSPTVQGWFEAAGARRVELGPLEADAARQLLRATAPELEGEAVERLLARAEGNPLFVRELALEGARAAQGRPGDPAPIPPTVEALLRARVDRQGPFEREVLHASAVVGRTFWREAVERLLGGPSGVAAALDDLSARRFILRRPTSEIPGAEAWQFAHALVHEVVYAGVAERTRATWHGRAALWLRHEAGGGDWSARIAAHHAAAGEHARAARAYAEAGRNALEAHAPIEARVALEAALSAQARIPNTAPAQDGGLTEAEHGALEAELALLVSAAGEHTNAATLLDRAVERATEPSIRAERLRRRALVDVARGLRDAARAHLARALEVLAEAPDTRSEAVERRVRHDAAWLLHRDGDYAGARTGLRAVLESLERSDAPEHELRGEVHNHLGVVAWWLGEYEDAADQYRRALEAFERCGAVQMTAAVFNNLGNLAQKQGDFDRATRWLERGLEVRLARGDRAGLARLYNNLGTLHGERGDFARARDYLLESVRIKQRIGDGGLAVSCANLGEAYLRLGEGDLARPWVERALALCTEGNGPGYLLPDAWRMSAELELLRGDAGAAHAAAERALALAVDTGDRPREAAALRVRASAELAAQDLTAADRTLERALEVLETLDQPMELGRTLRLRAERLASTHPAESEALLARARALLAATERAPRG